MPKTLPVEQLTFGHFIDNVDIILAQMSPIKELYSRAQGEITIRDALQELDVWGASTSFSLTPLSDSRGATIMLIKDWKDLVNSVGDNQRLLQSLKDSPYFPAFADKASIWELKLASLTEMLELLNNIQRKWVYLVCCTKNYTKRPRTNFFPSCGF